jgi:hypothetical protein
MEVYSQNFIINFKKFNEKSPLNDYSFSMCALNEDLGFNMLQVIEGQMFKSDLISRHVAEEQPEEQKEGSQKEYLSKVEIFKMNPGAKTLVQEQIDMDMYLKWKPVKMLYRASSIQKLLAFFKSAKIKQELKDQIKEQAFE